MPAADLTGALARLLADPALCAAFRQDPAAVARRLDLREADRPAFLALDPAGLENQARSLVDKRFHEVSRLLPRTVDRLGAAARPLFGDYAATLWPEGHRRHLADAAAFCRYLNNGHGDAIDRLERNRLDFAMARRRWAVHPLPGWRGIQVLIRCGAGATREAMFFLRRPAS